jgi:hypothetical protein
MIYMVIMAIIWIPFGEGYLGKSRHDHYFVYRNFDPDTRLNRWFAKYEGEIDRPEVQGKLISFHGFDELEDAQGSCEKHALEVEERL